MHIELTIQQQYILDKFRATPPFVMDPRTKITYVLVRMEEYEQLHEVLEEETRRKVIAQIALHNAAKRMNEDLIM